MLERRRKLAWVALLWERTWPALWPPTAVLVVFLALALIEVPSALGGWWHVALLAVFALAFVFAAWRALPKLGLPDERASKRRLETASGLVHRPLTTIEDRLAIGGRDLAARALWQAHLENTLARLGRIRVGWPRPGVGERDVHGLRAAVFLLAVFALAVGHGDVSGRLARAMQPDFDRPAQVAAEIEAWINPPAYTGAPPFQLAARAEGAGPFRIPTGSDVLARVYGGAGRVELLVDDAVVAFRAIDALNHELKHPLKAARRLAIRQGGLVIAAWAVETVPDTAPEIAFAADPVATPRGSLAIDVEARDDYGLGEARLEIRLAEGGEGEGDVESLSLPISSLGLKLARERSYHDLAAHPWAGRKVVLVPVVLDTQGQEGRGEAHGMVLPERRFAHPVARAIIEQRKTLFTEPDRKGMVALALSSIVIAPDSYRDDIVVFMGLRLSSSRLRFSRNPDVVTDVAKLLWDLALKVEEGRLSMAEREVRKLQKELMDALARDASDAELDQLMDQLQEAMGRYLQALAEQAKRMAEQGLEAMPYDPNAQVLEGEDIQRMLERARELAKLGAKDAAREMLAQLQQMLENLQAGRMMQMPPELRGADRAIRELGDLMRDQQKLLDQTFRRSPQGGQIPRPGQGRRGQGQQGRRGQPMPGQGDPSMSDMSVGQEALRRRLGEIMRRLGEGLGEIPGALGRAERAMRNAREALGGGRPGPASESQGQAIDQMAEGMRGLAQELARQLGNGQGEDTVLGGGEEDPLGRPSARGGMDTSTVRIPEKADLQRTRQILDELRRRAGEHKRPRLERQYIDRLLDRF